MLRDKGLDERFARVVRHFFEVRKIAFVRLIRFLQQGFQVLSEGDGPIGPGALCARDSLLQFLAPDREPPHIGPVLLLLNPVVELVDFPREFRAALCRGSIIEGAVQFGKIRFEPIGDAEILGLQEERLIPDQVGFPAGEFGVFEALFEQLFAFLKEVGEFAGLLAVGGDRGLQFRQPIGGPPDQEHCQYY